MSAPASPPAPATTTELPECRLDDLYAGRDDPRIEDDLQAAADDNRAIAALEGKFLAARADAGALGGLLDEGIGLYERALTRLWAVGAYASLQTSTRREDAAWSKFEGDMRARSSQIAAESIFFTLEINQLEDGEIAAALKASPAAARWAPWLRRVRLAKGHEMSGEMERYSNDRAPALANWSRLYDETLARMPVKAGRETLTLPEALNRLSDPEPARRKSAAQGLARALEQNEPTLALCLNTLAFEKQIEDRWRNYPDPALSRHRANEVDPEAVQALEEAVVERYPRLSHRYYALKARSLGKRALDYWDRNAPLDQAQPRQYGWDEAKSLVLTSFDQLGAPLLQPGATLLGHPR